MKLSSNIYNTPSTAEALAATSKLVKPSIMKGELKMLAKGTILTNWKTRFFVLENGAMEYFETEHWVLKGRYNLSGLIVIEATMPTDYDDSLTIRLKSHSKPDVCLMAENTQIKMQWIEAINKHIAYANFQVSSKSKISINRSIPPARVQNHSCKSDRNDNMSVYSEFTSTTSASSIESQTTTTENYMDNSNNKIINSNQSIEYDHRLHKKNNHFYIAADDMSNKNLSNLTKTIDNLSLNKYHSNQTSHNNNHSNNLNNHYFSHDNVGRQHNNNNNGRDDFNCYDNIDSESNSSNTIVNNGYNHDFDSGHTVLTDNNTYTNNNNNLKLKQTFNNNPHHSYPPSHPANNNSQSQPSAIPTYSLLSLPTFPIINTSSNNNNSNYNNIQPDDSPTSTASNFDAGIHEISLMNNNNGYNSSVNSNNNSNNSTPNTNNSNKNANRRPLSGNYGVNDANPHTFANPAALLMKKFGPPPICSGWMHKQGRIMPGIKKRFFVLENAYLIYYAKDINDHDGHDKPEVLGTLQVTNYQLITETSTGKIKLLLVPGDGAKDNRKYALYVDNFIDKDMWERALTQHFKYNPSDEFGMNENN
eukprot:gene13024-17456_t